MNKEQFLRGMTFLGVAYKTEFTEEEIEVWYKMLKDFTEEEFNIAIKELIKTEKYLPTIAHITEQIAKSRLKGFPKAEDEWQRVINAVHYFGSYREEEALNSLDKDTARIVELIGYYRICTSTQEEQVWNKKQFIEEYNMLKEDLMREQRVQIGTSEKKMLNE